MDIVTHSLAPVILARLVCRGENRLSGRALTAIGVAGSLPDLLNPHISLDARMNSWSHGLPCWAVFSLACAAARAWQPQRVPTRLAVLLASAYLLHLVCDAVSGGINWLHPAGNFVWGDSWVDPLWWIPLDVFFLLTAYYIFRLQPMLARNRAARS